MSVYSHIYAIDMAHFLHDFLLNDKAENQENGTR